MSGFTFLTRLKTGFNGSKSINALIASLVSSINTALGSGAIETSQLADESVTAAKLDADIITMKYADGVDSTSADTNIAITGVVSTQRIASVIDVTNKADVDKSWFVAYDGGITQLAGHDLNTSELLVTLFNG